MPRDVGPSVRECFYNRDGCLSSNAETDVRKSDVSSQPSSDKPDAISHAESQSGSSDLRLGYFTLTSTTVCLYPGGGPANAGMPYCSVSVPAVFGANSKS